MSTENENPTAPIDISLADIADSLARPIEPRPMEEFRVDNRQRPVEVAVVESPKAKRALGFQRVIHLHMQEVARMKSINLFEAQFECQILFEGGSTAIGMLRFTDDPCLYCITCTIVQDGKQVQGIVAEHYFHADDITRLVVPKAVPQQRIWSPNNS